MKLIIEISGGCVSGVYYQRADADQPKPMSVPDVYVVDLDAEKIGEETRAEQRQISPLKYANELTIEAMLRK